MQIVLTKDVPNVGHKGELVNVKSGYFRNFLAPRGKAIRVTPKLMQQLLDQKKQMEKRREEMLAQADDFAKKIEKMTVTFKQKTTKKDKLYAAITDKMVQKELEKHLKIELEKGAVKLDEPIKEVGEHTAKVRLTDTVSANLNVVVTAEK